MAHGLPGEPGADSPAGTFQQQVEAATVVVAECRRLRAQNATLLEALKATRARLVTVSPPERQGAVVEMADAAIKEAEA